MGVVGRVGALDSWRLLGCSQSTLLDMAAPELLRRACVYVSNRGPRTGARPYGVCREQEGL